MIKLSFHLAKLKHMFMPRGNYKLGFENDRHTVMGMEAWWVILLVLQLAQPLLSSSLLLCNQMSFFYEKNK